MKVIFSLMAVVFSASVVSSVASAEIGPINIVSCSYNDFTKSPVVTVDATNANWKTETEWSMDTLVLSVAYKKGGVKVIENAVVYETDLGGFPWISATAVTTSGRTMVIESNQETGEGIITVDGVEQTYGADLTCVITAAW